MEDITMKKIYIKPESELILLNSIQLLAGSPGAGEQLDPGLGTDPSRGLFDLESFEEDPLNTLLKY